MKEFWDNMYKGKEFIYWEKPNKFFAENILNYKPWRILLPADWEWRNWVFSAVRGWDVFCFDISEVWKDKAEVLAKKNNVNIDYTIQDYKNLTYKIDSFDLIVLSYTHFVNHSKKEYQEFLDKYLKKGWIVILEWFSKKHLWRQWWPQNINMLFNIENIQKDFNNYEEIYLKEEEVLLEEGKWHNAKSIVIRYIGKKR